MHGDIILSLDNLFHKSINHLLYKRRSSCILHEAFQEEQVLRIFQFQALVDAPVPICMNVFREIFELDVGENPNHTSGVLDGIQLVNVLVSFNRQVARHLPVETISLWKS